MRVFRSVEAGPDEVAAPRRGDDLVAACDVVMDRGFTVPAPPSAVWPWLVQLGKRRAGWYLPRSVERLVPPGRRALRHLDQRWQTLRVGDVIPDYGGRDETFTVAEVDPPHALVYESRRGRAQVSWAIDVRPAGAAGSRVHLRLRAGPLRHRRLVRTGGELLDALTVAGMASGLRERVTPSPEPAAGAGPAAQRGRR